MTHMPYSYADTTFSMTTCLSHNASPYYSVIACSIQSSPGIYFLTLELVSSQAVNLLIEPTLSCVKQLQYASVLLDRSNLVQPVSSLIAIPYCSKTLVNITFPLVVWQSAQRPLSPWLATS